MGFGVETPPENTIGAQGIGQQLILASAQLVSADSSVPKVVVATAALCEHGASC